MRVWISTQWRDQTGTGESPLDWNPFSLWNLCVRHTRTLFAQYQDEGFGHFPICMAKTQYSFSTDPSLKGAPSDHMVPIREIRLAAGAEFLVVVCGDIMTMPGLPRQPAAAKIGVDGDGLIIGLF